MIVSGRGDSIWAMTCIYGGSFRLGDSVDPELPHSSFLRSPRGVVELAVGGYLADSKRLALVLLAAVR